MVHRYMRDNGYGLTIVHVNPIVKRFTLIFGLRSNGSL
jgi:hypothetical protein